MCCTFVTWPAGLWDGLDNVWAGRALRIEQGTFRTRIVAGDQIAVVA